MEIGWTWEKINSLLTGTLGVFKTGGAGRASDSGWFQCLALYTAFVGDYKIKNQNVFMQISL